MSQKKECQGLSCPSRMLAAECKREAAENRGLGEMNPNSLLVADEIRHQHGGRIINGQVVGGLMVHNCPAWKMIEAVYHKRGWEPRCVWC